MLAQMLFAFEPMDTKYLKYLFFFQVVDLSADKSSGQVELVGGGVHQRFVEFKFISEIGKGLNYNIQTYSLQYK